MQAYKRNKNELRKIHKIILEEMNFDKRTTFGLNQLKNAIDQ